MPKPAAWSKPGGYQRLMQKMGHMSGGSAVQQGVAQKSRGGAVPQSVARELAKARGGHSGNALSAGLAATPQLSSPGGYQKLIQRMNGASGSSTQQQQMPVAQPTGSGYAALMQRMKKVRGSAPHTMVLPKSGGGYAGLMQRMQKASGGGVKPQQMSAQHQPKRAQLMQRSSSHASGGAKPNPRNAAMAKQVMNQVKETMANIQVINQHTRGHPHGAALKQIHALRSQLKGQMGELKKLTAH
jgi:hypothetical protein